jgi:gamma-glutamylcyclotransferase (GGCT)/AIG2-like uncharacterized protein YtfP
MSSLRIRKRCPSAVPIDIGYVTGYKFLFNKVSKDGSGKGNAIRTNSEDDRIWGVIFEISENEKRSLDKAEGKGKGYAEQTVDVTNGAGQQFEAQIYLAIDPAFLNNELIPFDWYKEHCIRGAKEFKLPAEYVAFLENFESLADTDAERRNQELAL